jgi:hypothetical protein
MRLKEWAPLSGNSFGEWGGKIHSSGKYIVQTLQAETKKWW